MITLSLFPLSDCTSTSTRTFFLIGVCDGSIVGSDFGAGVCVSGGVVSDGGGVSGGVGAGGLGVAGSVGVGAGSVGVAGNVASSGAVLSDAVEGDVVDALETVDKITC
jgi:hypothetical protein